MSTKVGKKGRKGTKKNNVTLREKALNNGNKSLYLDIYRDGVRSYEFLKLYINDKARTPIERQTNKETLELAEKIRTDRERELNHTAFDFIAPTKQKVLFFEFAQSYIDAYTKKDIRMLKGAVEDFKNFLNEKKPGIKHASLKLSQIDRLIIIDFIDYLQANHSGEGADSYYKRFKKILNYAVAKNYIQKSPAQKKDSNDSEVTCKKPDGLRKQILTNDEIQLIAKTQCNSLEVKKAFLFCLCTGLRFVDVKALKYADIDFASGQLKLIQQKTGRPVIIDLNRTALKLIGEAGKPGELIFDLPGYAGCVKTIKALVLRAGINKHITWHCARHSIAVNLLTSDERPDIKTVSSILGHASTKMTEVYLHVVDDLKKKAVNALPDYDI